MENFYYFFIFLTFCSFNEYKNIMFNICFRVISSNMNVSILLRVNNTHGTSSTSIIYTYVGMIIIIFFFSQIAPGDPVVSILGIDAPEERKEALRKDLGLDDPVPVQFVNYVKNIVLHGDLGTSYKTGLPVAREIMGRFRYTVILAVGAVALGVLVGIPMGVVSAVKQYSWLDSGILAVAVFGSSVPGFWLALMLISLFAVRLGWVPTAGIMNPRGWILPIFVVMVQSMSNLMRITRSSMLETIRQDYIRTAKAKGQSDYKVVVSHALRNSLIPILSSVGNSIGVQLGGALIVETVFGVPGIGKYAVDAIGARNYPAVMGSVIVLAFTFTLVNLIVDLSYVAVDSRMKSNLISTGRKKPAVSERGG